MIDSRTSRIRAAVIAGIPIAAILLAMLAPSATADVDSVNASAYGATLQSSLLGAVIAPTPLTSGTATEPVNSFGPTSQSSVPVNVIGLLSVGVLNARVEGGDVAADEPAGHFGFAAARASVADVVVALGAISIDALETQCRSDGTGSTGFTELVGGVLGGNPLITSPLPNTSLTLPGILEVTLNEQTIQNSIGSTSIQVRGAHITVLPGLGSLLGVVEIVLAESNCAATGPDVNVVPTTSTTTTTAPTTTTTDDDDGSRHHHHDRRRGHHHHDHGAGHHHHDGRPGGHHHHDHHHRSGRHGAAGRQHPAAHHHHVHHQPPGHHAAAAGPHRHQLHAHGCDRLPGHRPGCDRPPGQ